MLVSFLSVNAQIINIPDANFKARLLAAGPSNKIASTEEPIYIAAYQSWIPSSYERIDTNYDGAIDMNEARAVKWLDISKASIVDLTGIENFTSLVYLRCRLNQLTNLNVSTLKNLKYLNCNSNRLKNINVSGLNNLEILICSYNQLSTLDVSNLINLEIMHCEYNKLTSINLDGIGNMDSINCYNNQFTTLDLTGVTDILYLNCASNNLSTLDLSMLNTLHNLICSNNHISSLNLNGLSLDKLNYSANNLTSVDINNFTNIKSLFLSSNHLSSIDLNNFINVETLDISSNQLSSIDLSANIALSSLFCGGNQLTNLDLNNNLSLTTLNCSNNQLTNLDLNNNVSLASLNCSNNQLRNLDLNNNVSLASLNCSNNQLTNLFLNKNVLLCDLNCSANQLKSLELADNYKLYSLYCSYNQLSTLDFNRNYYLNKFDVSYNKLTSLYIKNGNPDLRISGFNDNPNLNYICADDVYVDGFRAMINYYGYQNCHVNSYCSFTPGGTFYTINGQTKLDVDNNGCEASDLNLANLKFNISNGTITGSFISNATGNYSIPVQAGTHTITPVIENSTYFNVSPASTTVTFPTQASPFTQDFCVTPNGTHSDVEVSVIPVEAARPGFDVKYKIIYKNKGNQVENGSVNLTFDDAKMDYVSLSPVFNSQATNQFTWNYSNLQPFETRTIDLVFNMNSPMETPAVNGGDVLIYTATITSANTDELPSDNTFTLNQTVVNSFDPNDITCLEGAKVSTSKIGDYVHYMIRFENTGSANATNIVVKDGVDNAKYDVNSIIPIKGSHDFTTRVNGDKVEFIFENINLPFDDATNDGYVSFKIKTKASLVAGDTFSKNANIYFDYNFPITTNTATTTIAALANQDFEFETYFNLYPNPASSNVTIDTKSDIELYSVQVYNALGQLVLVVPNAKNVKNVDVSGLTSGNYFIKINSDKGTSHTKFVKQ